MTIDESVQSELAALPPGPWSAFGSSVYAGTQVVCMAPGARGVLIAQAIAKLPDLLRILVTAHPDTLAARIAELEEECEELTQECDALRKSAD